MTRSAARAIPLLVCYALALAGCARAPASDPGILARTDEGCLPGQRGSLQASLRGALLRDIDWHGATIVCDGGARPDGRGIRLSIAGPIDAARPGGDRRERLRFVLGIAGTPGESTHRALPTNITVIVENGGKLYATLGDGHCTVESLTQEPLPDSLVRASGGHVYRVAARGFCVDAATSMDGGERLYIDRFDIAGRARFEDQEIAHGPPVASPGP